MIKVTQDKYAVTLAGIKRLGRAGHEIAAVMVGVKSGLYSKAQVPPPAPHAAVMPLTTTLAAGVSVRISRKYSALRPRTSLVLNALRPAADGATVIVSNAAAEPALLKPLSSK